jgi:glycosyltransferase involved in cell wall biosynthesis
MKKVIIYICAYNAQDSIQRTINSVLSQSCHEWLCFVVNNGSSDSTGEMIDKYTKRDKRIILLTNRQNHIWEPGNSWYDIVNAHNDYDYFCWLDADDEYKPTFLERSL